MEGLASENVDCDDFTASLEFRPGGSGDWQQVVREGGGGYENRIRRQDTVPCITDHQ